MGGIKIKFNPRVSDVLYDSSIFPWKGRQHTRMYAQLTN
jgi:hypothetical protein